MAEGLELEGAFGQKFELREALAPQSKECDCPAYWER